MKGMYVYMTYEEYVKYLNSKCKEEVMYEDLDNIASKYCNTSDEYLDNLTSEDVDVSQYLISIPSAYLTKMWKRDAKAMTVYEISVNSEAMSLEKKMELRKFLVEMNFVDVYKVTSNNEICFISYQSKEQRHKIIEPIIFDTQCLVLAPL
jgi:hypothetical protein